MIAENPSRHFLMLLSVFCTWDILGNYALLFYYMRNAILKIYWLNHLYRVNIFQQSMGSQREYIKKINKKPKTSFKKYPKTRARVKIKKQILYILYLRWTTYNVKYFMNCENSSISFFPGKQKYKIRKKSHFKKKSCLVNMKQWVNLREPKNTFF